METLIISTGMGWVATALEIIAVALIGTTFIHALLRSIMHFRKRNWDAYQNLKLYLGKSLMLGLEFLVAADIIRTVLIEDSAEGVYSLGVLIIMRIALGWSIAVETEGCWPWQLADRARSAKDVNGALGHGDD